MIFINSLYIFELTFLGATFQSQNKLNLTFFPVVTGVYESLRFTKRDLFFQVTKASKYMNGKRNTNNQDA